MNEPIKECKDCGTLNPPEASRCKNCGFEFLINDDEKAVLNALKQISGVGSSRARNIVDAGFSDVEELDDVDLESITSIEGIGESIASDIVETIEDTKEEGGLYLCDQCGAFVGKKSEICSNCGAVMEDLEEEQEEEKVTSEESVSEKSKEGGSLYLCSNCGSFIGSDSETCKHCGAEMEDDDVVEDEISKEDDTSAEGSVPVDTEGQEEEEDDGLFLCTNCGAFVSVASTECPQCSFTFSDEEIVDEEVVDEEVVDEEVVDEEVIDEKVIDEEVIGEELVDEEVIGEEVIDEELVEEEVIDEEAESDIKDIFDIEKLEKPEEGLAIEQDIEYDDQDADEIPFDIEDQLKRDIEELEKREGIDQEIDIEKSYDGENIESEETTSTVSALPVGDDVKICGNCGYISERKVDECPLCENEFSDSEVDISDTEPVDDSAETDVDTFKRAFGISQELEEIPDDEDVLKKDQDLQVCTICGAFLKEESERCSVCGSLISEIPDLDSLEESPHIDYTDEKINLCDACGAFVNEDYERCSICGSDMGVAMREVEDEEVSGPKKDQEDVLERFFGVRSVEGSAKDEVEDEIELYLCNSCGAMVSAEAEQCSICLSDLTDEDVEPVEEDLISREIEDIDDVSGPEDIEELKDIESELDEIMDEDEPGYEQDELDIELNQEIEAILKDKYKEDISHEEKLSGQSEGLDEVPDDTDLERTIDELRKDILSGDKEDKIEDEWEKCPACNSHVSIDSDYCSVCDHPLAEDIDKRTTYKSTEPEIKAQKSSNDITPKTPTLSKKTTSYKTSSDGSDFIDSHIKTGIKDVLYKAKDYEVPISSLSLLAFGGVYLTTYRTTDFMYFTEMILLLIGLFFGVGALTLFIFKDEFLSYSYIGFVGYLSGIFVSSTVPISSYMLGMELPILACAGMIAAALGIFWILDYKLPEKFHYYMMWFSGISILFVVLLVILFYPVEITPFEYPLILTVGLGSVMVVGGTVTWYRKANEIYGASGSQRTPGKVYTDKETGQYFEDISKTCPISNEEAVPYYSNGIASCSVGEYDDAIDKFRKALDLEGDNEAIWNNLGTSYSRVGDQEKAKGCFKRAINLEEDYAIAWNNLGNANFRCGKYSEALNCYDKALEIEENYRDAMINKSKVLTKLSKMEDF